MSEIDGLGSPRIPGYRIGPILGAGSRASVYRASKEGHSREVALKLIPLTAFEESARPDARLTSVIEQVASMGDPRVAHVLDFGITEQHAYIAHELVEEGTLAQRLMAGETVDLTRALRLCIDVGQALACAHALGLTHGDVKPSNILIPSWDSPIVMDFGLMNILHDDRTLLATNAMIGGWVYFAPERRQVEAVSTPRGDVFALGALLAFLVTGQEPYDIHNQVVRDELTAGLSANLVAVIRTATQYEPRDRFADASGFRLALSQASMHVVGRASKGRRDQLTLAETSVLTIGGRGAQGAPSLSDGDMVLIVAEPKAGEHLGQSKEDTPRGRIAGSVGSDHKHNPHDLGATKKLAPNPFRALHLRIPRLRFSAAKGAGLLLLSIVIAAGLSYQWEFRPDEALSAELQIADTKAAEVVPVAAAEPHVGPSEFVGSRETPLLPLLIDEKTSWETTEQTTLDKRSWKRLRALPGM